MDTISKDKGRIWDSLQFKFGLSYILIIAGVLLLLNTYPLRVSQDLVFRSKATTLQSSVSVMVYSLSGLDRLTEENVSQAMAVVEETGLSRILVTDSAGKVLYDTRETNDALGEYSFYTEIVQALLGNDVFSSSYRDGAFRSRAASPVLYQNQIIGAVYAYEYDTEQAALLEGLQGNLLRLSAGIAVVVLCLSGLLSRALTRKIGQLLTAIREVREGAYSHRAEVPGRDEIAQLAQEFNRLTDRLQTTEEVRRRFVSDASHELKTPLAVISTSVDLLRRGVSDPEEPCQTIQRETRQMARLIDDMLVLTNGGTGRWELQLQPLVPEDISMSVYEKFVPIFAQKAQELTLQLPDTALPSVFADEQRLEQILSILLDNAHSYAPEGSSVQLRVDQCEEGKTRFWVVDHGPGIPDEEKQAVFHYFYRREAQQQQAPNKAGHYGLGLSVATELARLQQGSLTVLDTPGGGATFCLTVCSA